MCPPRQRLGGRVKGGRRIGLTLNSKIGDLVLAISEIIVNSDGKTTTVALEIPNQSFCLEITVKPKEEVQDDSKI